MKTVVFFIFGFMSSIYHESEAGCSSCDRRSYHSHSHEGSSYRRSYLRGSSRNRAFNCDNLQDVDSIFSMSRCSFSKCRRHCERKAHKYEGLELTATGCLDRRQCGCEARLCTGYSLGGIRRIHRGSVGYGASSWTHWAGAARGHSWSSWSRSGGRRRPGYSGEVVVTTTTRRRYRRRRAGTGTRRGRANCRAPSFESFGRKSICYQEEDCARFCKNRFSSDLYDASLEENSRGKAKCVCLACEGGRRTRGRYRLRRRARNTVCANPRVREPFSFSCTDKRDEAHCIVKCEGKYRNKLANAYCVESVCVCETCGTGRRKRRRRRRPNKDCLDTSLDILRYGGKCSSDSECDRKCGREFSERNVQNAFCDSNRDCCCDRCLSRRELRDEEREWENYGEDKNAFVDIVSAGGGCNALGTLRDIFSSFGK
jgi:hypothetical protein